MPVLANPKHERFAQELAKGNSASEAYRIAGYKPSRHHASRLATKGNVRSRIDELSAKVAEKAEVTLESLIREAEQVRAAAFEAGQFSAAISAIKEKGVLTGHRVEKRENAIRMVSQVSDDDLQDIATGRGAGVAAPESRSSLVH